MGEVFVVGNKNTVGALGDEYGFAGLLGKGTGTAVKVLLAGCLNGFVAVGFEDDVFKVGDAGARVGEEDDFGMLFGYVCELGGDPVCEDAAVGFLDLVEGNDTVYLGQEMVEGVDELIFEVGG